MSLYQFIITTPPVPPGLHSFDFIPVWVLNKNHALAQKYDHLIKKLQTTQEANDKFTLLSLPDIEWIKTFINEEHFEELHAFVRGYFYGVLHGSLLKYAGNMLASVPLEHAPSSGGYLYIEYDPSINIPPEIFGLYGAQLTGLQTKGTWEFRTTTITQPLLDLNNLERIAPIGRIGPITSEGLPFDNFAGIAHDLRTHEKHARRFTLSPEHPHPEIF